MVMALDAVPLSVNTLPVLLAGPVLRRLTRNSGRGLGHIKQGR